jgi:hypothetical protein
MTNSIIPDTDLPPTEATVSVSNASSLGCANSTLSATLASTLATWVVALLSFLSSLSLSLFHHKFRVPLVCFLCLKQIERKFQKCEYGK